MKSIRHMTSAPKTKAKKEKVKETTKGGLPSYRGKRVARSPFPPPSPKYTPWFEEEYYEASYFFSYAKKEQIQPKFLNLSWLKSHNFVFSKVLEYHGLHKLMEMKDTFYPNLVKVFYTTTHMDGEARYLCATVKGKFIVMAHEL